MSNRRKQLRESTRLAANSCVKAPSQNQKQPAGDRPEKETNQNDKDKIVSGDKHPLVVILEIIGLVVFAALAGLFGSTGHIVPSIWSVWGVIFSALVLTAHFIGKSKPNWAKWVRWICGLVLAAVALWFGIWTHSICNPRLKETSIEEIEPAPKQENNDFSVKFVTMLIGRPDNPFFWLLYTNDVGLCVRSGVATLIYVEFTNLKPTSCSIDDYSMEIEMSAGKWESAHPIDTRDKQLYCTTLGMSKAVAVDTTINSFNSRIEGKKIPGNGGIARGWMYFSGNILPVGKCRLRFDSGGETFTKEFHSGHESRKEDYEVHINNSLKAQTAQGDGQDTFLRFLSATQRDLSDVPVIPQIVSFHTSNASSDSKDTSTQHFSIVTQNAIVEKKRIYASFFWFRYDGPSEHWVCPAHIAMFVALTSQKPIATMIESYSVEAELTKGNWAQLPAIDVSLGALYWVNQGRADPLSDACKVTFVGETLVSALRRKNITPGETTYGWIFLEAPTNGSIDHLRLRVQETDGEESVQYFINPKPPLNSIAQDNTMFTLGPGKEDISRYQRVFYSDVVHFNWGPR